MEHLDIIGRKSEIALLKAAQSSPNAELIALYGRYRAGKTHLGREFLKKNSAVYFSVTGEKDGPKILQLENFYRELNRVFEAPARPGNWREALSTLADHLEKVSRKKKIGVFLDELPWLATHRSGFLQAFDHLWNTRLSLLPNLSLILCGSAASWMINNLVHAKGGLYNRVTRRICLLPFNLRETQEFLAARKIRLKQPQIVELYLCFGGIPHYLMQVRKGQSAAQAISETCLSTNGILTDEYEHLFASLFKQSEIHRRIVEALARKRGGLSRSEIMVATGLTSGGRLATRLHELEASGFITRMDTYGYRVREPTYRVMDEYILFYLKWMRKTSQSVFKHHNPNHWPGIRRSPSYHAWAGNAFEAICIKHVHHIQKKLQIESILSQVGSWRYVPSKGQKESPGAQIDLLFDREDGVIQICEIKYADDVFTITKDYARQLAQKMEVFETRTKTKKQLHLVMICANGLKRNLWSEDLVDAEVSLDDFF